MNSKNTTLVLVSSLLLTAGLAFPVLAQNADDNPPASASSSMHQAGQDTKGAAQNAYHGTITAVDDTRITTEVKAGLANGKDIHSNLIHVTTTAGIVTLDGQVQDADIAARAESIARDTSGVRGVTNDLRVSSSQD